MITVYFDGMCGLCAREIAYYRRIAPQNVFEWRDVARDKNALASVGISQADALRLLHATDAAGKLHVGVDAFLLIWKALPRWRFLAAIVGAPVIRPIAGGLYRRFAAWRFRRLKHCQFAANASNEEKA